MKAPPGTPQKGGTVQSAGSLFSGIGGLDLGLERAGWHVRWQSEVDPYASRVLAKHWPNVPNLGDVTTVDWSIVEPVDLICGGYPCQPFSLAGQRAGDEDARHLWPYFAGAIRVLRPRWALLENVPGHLSLGFGDVLADLASLGYDTDWACIPAAAMGAPHLRYRIFVVAHTNCGRLGANIRDVHPRQSDAPGGGPLADTTGQRLEGARPRRRPTGHSATLPNPIGGELWDQPVPVSRRYSSSLARDDGTQRSVADTEGERRGWPRWAGSEDGWPTPQLGGCCEEMADPASSSIGRRSHERRSVFEGHLDQQEPITGDGSWWSSEPDVGRVAHGVPNRVDRLRTLGNAVVPQVAEWVGRQILTAQSGRPNG